MLKKVLSVAVAMSIVMVGALPAFAGSHDSEDDPIVQYDDIQHVMVFSVDGICTLTKDMDVTFTVDESGDITFDVDPATVEEGTSTEGCVAISVEGPNGQVNHGTVVSSLVKALKEMDLDVPLGQALKSYAKSDLGKGGMQVKVSDIDDLSTLTDDGSLDTLEVKPAKAEKTNRGQGKKSNKGRNK